MLCGMKRLALVLVLTGCSANPAYVDMPVLTVAPVCHTVIEAVRAKGVAGLRQKAGKLGADAVVIVGTGSSPNNTVHFPYNSVTTSSHWIAGLAIRRCPQ